MTYMAVLWISDSLDYDYSMECTVLPIEQEIKS